MSKPPEAARELELEIAVVQCSIAFGQGAGMIGVSADVVPHLVELYRPLIAHHMPNWKSESNRILNLAEALGRSAARIAVSAGKLTIDLNSVTMATHNLGPANCLPPI